MKINKEALQGAVTNALLGKILDRPEVAGAIDAAMANLNKPRYDLYALYKTLREKGVDEAQAFQYLQDIYEGKGVSP